ncbi:MAG: transposase [Candidatus Omnitrophica bacterium]|nr:transposase [Candidatus Omnitrophota bacterium]
MPRAKRILFDNAVYHIVQRGHNKDILFSCPDEFRLFKDFIYRYKLKYPCKIYHYCLMSNHFHLLIRPIEAANLPKFMQGITLSYSIYYKGKYSHVGHVYQNRYKSFLIEDDAYLLECGRYIERNPLRACIAGHPSMYYWSSYKFYANGKKDDIININPVYETLGNTGIERQKAYKEYVDQARPYEKILDSAMLK